MSEHPGPAPIGEEPEPRGSDLARRALEQARATAKAKGKAVGQGRSSPARGTRRRWSGSGPDDRDPQSLGALTTRMVKTRQWSDKVIEGTVLGRWESVVGPDIAAHACATSLTEGVLHISAESTAWATQLRLVQSTIIAKIAAAVGNGVVTSVRITGPQAPSWRKGERHVSGRGPRDTYG